VTPKPVTRSLCDADDDDDDVTAAIQRRGGATTQTDLGQRARFCFLFFCNNVLKTALNLFQRTLYHRF